MRSSSEDISRQKKELRKQIKEKFCSVFGDPSYRAESSDFSLKESMSKNVLSNLEKLPIWQEADIIFAFSPLKDEVDISFFTEAAYNAGKKVALPRITGDIIDFCFINPTESNFTTHKYGMKEPSATIQCLDLSKESFMHLLILVPGLAFDSSCNRLGRGKSFYDRFLFQFIKKNSRITTAAIAFNFQIVDKVPVEEHDIALDYIITEDVIYGRN